MNGWIYKVTKYNSYISTDPIRKTTLSMCTWTNFSLRASCHNYIYLSVYCILEYLYPTVYTLQLDVLGTFVFSIVRGGGYGCTHYKWWQSKWFIYVACYKPLLDNIFLDCTWLIEVHYPPKTPTLQCMLPAVTGCCTDHTLKYMFVGYIERVFIFYKAQHLNVRTYLRLQNIPPPPSHTNNT